MLLHFYQNKLQNFIFLEEKEIYKNEKKNTINDLTCIKNF